MFDIRFKIGHGENYVSIKCKDISSAFMLLHEAMNSGPQVCFYKGDGDRLIRDLIDIADGKMTFTECNMFRVEKYNKEYK